MAVTERIAIPVNCIANRPLRLSSTVNRHGSRPSVGWAEKCPRITTSVHPIPRTPALRAVLPEFYARVLPDDTARQVAGIKERLVGRALPPDPLRRESGHSI